ncbi:lipid A export permease/ATP-binding protein MsbA [Desulfotalea psychrophila]|uniref:ATP-dependent lipid A-core flippase n=1 Tax=Desulfotalea psychrophila (strain LSv54 / DSM 12343) TaxID=177439 RepID=MSBA_DESPS|nr:lipid A export permease/ATP-binding protein MsbA [Desulfotalea psychrophila]Q6AJW3.1 RecName: Full=ATP-dependent lipid A-core flippase; AltName: Full=Lipid A export ATP-binding/permease protein MsbA [Desulfotalea psychrophila LSv54]CAG37363.1 related to ABC-transporter, ATP-binding protein [Desulfotalea psychrophila LSv54]
MTNKEIIKRLYHEIIPYKIPLFIAMFAMIVVAALTGAQAYLVKDLLDKIFMEKDVFFLQILPLIIIAIFFTKGVLYYTYAIILERVGQSIIRDFRLKIFAHIHRQSLSFFHNTPTGTLISRVLSDVALMQQAVSTVIIQLLRDFFQVIFLLGVIFYMNWKLALICFLIIPLAAIPIVKFGKIFRKLSTKTQEETAEVSNMLHETISGSRIVKAFCREDYEVERFHRQVETLFTITMKNAKYRVFQSPLMEIIGGFAVAGIIWVGGSEVINGSATPGTFFAFLTAMITAYDPVKRVSQVNSTIQQGLASAQRVFAILDIKPEIEDKPEATSLAPFKESIEFHDVSFSYGTEKILSHINLKVPAGEALAIVGPSGGGKTTLTNLIPRFIDLQEGSITIDGTDIRDVTTNSLRNQIAMVTQQTILFNDTIRNNIAYGKDSCTEEEIRRAAKAAHALTFIEELPNGFDTALGEGGAKLSGGQRQRISIARALLADAPILILDEATSALDTESEREVQKALENLMQNRTTFVIAHRLSTIKNASRIVVVKKGKIVEEGSHEELLKLEGEYQLLYNMQ